MMAKLTVVVEVEADPSLADPHDLAEALVVSYLEERYHARDDWPKIWFVSAEWGPA